MNYEPLKSKQIIEILDGDLSLGDPLFISTIRMPYLTGNKIRELASKLGYKLPQNEEYSRKNYYLLLLEYVIKDEKVDEFLNYIFSIQNLRDIFGDCNNEMEVYDEYYRTIQAVIEKINSILLIDGYRINRLDNNKFHYTDTNTKVLVEIPQIKEIDSEYVKKVYEKINIDIENCEYDNAVTKSRTLIEEILIYGMEKGKSYIVELYRIYDGANKTVKVRNKVFSQNSFEEKDLLRIDTFDREGKWTRNNETKEWIKSTTEFEDILNNYQVVKE